LQNEMVCGKVAEDNVQSASSTSSSRGLKAS
jgi:hypothetical protein